MDFLSSNKIISNGANDSFASRQQKLFDQLSNVEKSYNKNRDSSSRHFEINSNQLRVVKRNYETRNFQGKESIFKRPELPAPRTNYRSIPDYHRNPHKWVKYDLDDVKNKDMSDKSNTQTALSFLRDLKQRRTKNHNKINEEDRMDIEIRDNNNSSTSLSRISFKKPSKNNCKSDTVIIDNDDKPVFRNSKIILPEYVVGQKRVTKIKKDKKVATNVVRTKELKLDHLQDNDDED